MSQTTLCNQCKKEITSTNYVKCFNCNSNYHFSPCCPLSESTYLTMYGERKTSWKCQMCKPRVRSPNTLYHSVIFEDNNTKKQARTDNDEEQIENEQAKKFKESMSLTSLNTKLSSVESDVTELKSDIKDVKSTIDQLSANINASHMQIKDEIKNALISITNTLTTLVTQVKELNEKDKQRDAQICTIEQRVNKIEQQMINKNIEIKNITNDEVSAYDIVKSIGKSLNVDISDGDLINAYRLNKQNKVIVEFSSLSKKTEFMSKIKRHRVDATIINKKDVNNELQISYIYINDQLTFTNRRLLWLAKTKAKENNWKFVWVRNGMIFARKNENAPLLVITNTTDIESINATN